MISPQNLEMNDSESEALWGTIPLCVCLISGLHVSAVARGVCHQSGDVASLITSVGYFAFTAPAQE